MSRSPSNPGATPPQAITEAHRIAAEDRFVALVRQEAMRAFVGATADLRDDELRAAFSIALLALRETQDQAHCEAAGRGDAVASPRPGRTNPELEALRLLSMQLVDIGEATPDEATAHRPRKRPVGH